MHHIYHTEGIILGSRNYGEAGKCFYIFTRDLGMVYASAQGVRKMSSKLRYVLQDFSYVKVDLVRGRDFWRVTSASKTNELGDFVNKIGAMEVFSNVARLLKRLLAGEDKNEILFDDLLRGLKVLEKTNSIAEIRNVEVLLVLRVLHHLGYVGGGEAMGEYAVSPFEDELVYQISKNRAKVLSHINKALRETQL
ncbi:MAG: DNA repair protein RecO [Candidatus Pacebacteria bacterium]|nr:DNA repair protein RecO [Candidatus Paceibacterota bacterium]